MKMFSAMPGDASRQYDDQPSWLAAPALANRRRLQVFSVTVLLALVASLAYTFLRAPEYRAAARLQINPGSLSGPAEGPNAARQDSSKPFLTEIQVLTSRPLVLQVVQRLTEVGYRLESLGADPAERLQQMLTATPVEGTQVVELAATGPQAELTAAVVNALIAAYQQQSARAHTDTSATALAQTRDELGRLERSVAAKRVEVETFRARHNIVSLEREENPALARIKGQSTALNLANERLAAAEGKLRSIQESLAAGRSAARAKDDPTLASLEQRASQAREELRDMERVYTPAFMNLDARSQALRARVSELEQQIKLQRETSKQTALAEAQEEAASAREAANRIRQDMAQDKQALQEFTTRFSEYKALQEALTQLEGVQRAAQERLAKLQASEQARAPSVDVVEAAAIPRQPWRPLYARDAALSVAGSLLVGLLVMGLVELFNRSPPQPTVLVPQPWGPAPTLLRDTAMPPPLPAQRAALLPAQQVAPRELTEAEIEALIAAAGDQGRLACLALLSGLGTEELLALRWDQVDLDHGVIRVAGESARTMPLSQPLQGLLAALKAGRDLRGVPVLHSSRGTALDTAELDSLVLCAAHDAGIEPASQITPAVLRHTYIAFLVRQGIRFADLGQVVGRLSAQSLASFEGMSPPAPRRSADAIDRVLPAVRRMAAG